MTEADIGAWLQPVPDSLVMPDDAPPLTPNPNHSYTLTLELEVGVDRVDGQLHAVVPSRHAKWSFHSPSARTRRFELD